MKPILDNGTILNSRYKIVAVLGGGDFGVVYQARDIKDGGDCPMVAIKQMPMQSIVDCERQADVRAALLHPSVPKIYGYFSTDTHAYLVQELILGWNLEMALEKQPGFLSEETVTGWSIQLCGLLDYLHNHPDFPMIFRDLKPNNVMVDRAGRIYAVDFGLARVFPPGFFQNPQPKFAHFWKGLEMGTAGYSPPEQYEGMVRPQSDIFALGATLHHLLTRRDPRKHPPFTFDRYPVRSLNPAVSAGLEAVVMKALDLNIERRFASAREMQRALEAVQRN